MAAIGMQTKARAAKKRLRPPSVKTRKSAMSDTAIIVEVTAPDGTGLLIEFDTHRDNGGLVINPYRADAGVSIRLRDHTSPCALRNDPALPVRCDCGADFVPETDAGRLCGTWRPTAPREK